MKKIIIFLLAFNFSFACYCEGDIAAGFTYITTQVVSSNTQHQAQLKALQNKLDEAKKLLQEQEQELKIENELVKNLILKKKNLVFILNKKLKLEE